MQGESSKEKMRRLRKRRNDAGLRQFGIWILEEDREAVRQAVKPFTDRAETKIRQIELIGPPQRDMFEDR